MDTRGEHDGTRWAVAASQGILRVPGHQQRQGRGKGGSRPESGRDHGPADTFVFELQPPEL